MGGRVGLVGRFQEEWGSREGGGEGAGGDYKGGA